MTVWRISGEARSCGSCGPEGWCLGVPLLSGDGSEEGLLTFWIRTVHTGACCVLLFLPRDAYATYRHIAVYARVCYLSQGHKAVFYQCSWAYHHAINRKLRWTLCCHITGHMNFAEIFGVKNEESFLVILGRCLRLCMILGLSVLVEHRLETDGRTHDDSIYHASIASRGSERWRSGVVICLEWSANNLHMVQLLLLPPRHLLPH